MPTTELCQTPLNALACGAGLSALGGLGVLLALVLPTAGLLVWWSAHVPPRPNAALTPNRSALRDGIFVTLIVAAVSAFAAIAYGVARNGAFLDADRAFSAAAHGGISASVIQVFAWITHLGNGSTLALLCAVVVLVLLVRGERLLAIGFVAALGGNGLVDAVLKRVFVRVRPPADGVLQQFHGWSFPSGHAAGMVVACGFLAYLALRLLPRRLHVPCVMLAIALVLLVGASRIFINAHYASDVLAGYASGTAWLLLCILVIERSLDASHQPGNLGSARSSLSSTSPM